METKTPKTRVLELEITRECQLACTHCYAGSGPGLGHGTLTTQEWLSVIAQAAHLGIKQVQMIGGEPTLHPDLPRLIGFALDVRLAVEVYTNLVHVTPELWTVFAQDRVTLATSYYSDDPAETAKITGRLSYARTRASIAETVRRAIPIRVGLVDIQDGQRIEQARAELVELGVPAEKIRVDRARGFGRAAQPGAPSCDVSELCGQCGNGRAAVSPTGDVWPCVMARWMTAGNVRKHLLGDILTGDAMLTHTATIPRQRALAGAGGPSAMPCGPAHDCNPAIDGNDCAPAETFPDD